MASRIPLAVRRSGADSVALEEFQVGDTLADVWVAASNVTQHQAALSIAWAQLTSVPATFAPSAHTHPWADITGEPTTLAGYGIVDAAPLVHTHPWADITGEPTTLAGYGIVDAAALVHVHSGADITSGTVADARLSANVPLLNASNIFTANQQFNEDIRLAFGKSFAIRNTANSAWIDTLTLYDDDGLSPAAGGLSGAFNNVLRVDATAMLFTAAAAEIDYYSKIIQYFLSTDGMLGFFAGTSQFNMYHNGGINLIATTDIAITAPSSVAITSPAVEIYSSTGYVYIENDLNIDGDITCLGTIYGTLDEGGGGASTLAVYRWAYNNVAANATPVTMVLPANSTGADPDGWLNPAASSITTMTVLGNADVTTNSITVKMRKSTDNGTTYTVMVDGGAVELALTLNTTYPRKRIAHYTAGTYTLAEGDLIKAYIQGTVGLVPTTVDVSVSCVVTLD